MARWKVSFDPHGSPTGGPVAADIRERTAFAAGTTRALFRWLTCVNAISIASPHPVPGRYPSRFGTIHRGSYDRLCAAHAAIQALSGSEMVHHGD